ncbi:MAG: formate dehydrogenase subunit delta [Rhodobacteraceae bacterium]|nr:formate dehydrogenase subunit delta [Paracoccaceae bacterium]
MAPEKLAYMANQIAKFFETRDEDEAVSGIAEHLSKFWEPRMRRQFFELVEKEPDLFTPRVVLAAPQVRPVQ